MSTIQGITLYYGVLRAENNWQVRLGQKLAHSDWLINAFTEDSRDPFRKTFPDEAQKFTHKNPDSWHMIIS